MKGGRRPLGFTIVEVLIVLAVSMAIFLSAIMLVGGKQNSTEFTQASHDIQSLIQQTVNEVINGYYPNSGTFDCAESTTGPPQITAPGAGSAKAQGTNAGCIFLGKVMQFAVDNADSPTIDIYTLIGNQHTPTGQPTQTVNQTDPILLAGQSGVSVGPVPQSLEYGLSVVCMNYYAATPTGAPCNAGANASNPPTPTNAVVFYSGPTNPSNSTTLESGSQAVNIAVIQGTNLGDSSTSFVSSVNSSPNFGSSTPTSSTGGVYLCLKSGGTKQSALLTIAGNNRQPSVSLAIKDTEDCS